MPERLKRLNGLGFVWDALAQQWEENFQALKAYKKEFGDCLVNQQKVYLGLNLGLWLNRQRSKKDELPLERIQRLDNLGFVWDPRIHRWEENFKALVAYKAEFGDCLVPATRSYQGFKLGSWVNRQRFYVEKRLTPERIQRLNDLGFVWDPHIQLWEESFTALAAYKAEFGDCLVPKKLSYQGFKLGSWVATQRTKKATLSPERIRRLDDLGFVWKIR
jgi:hypothetical protein